MATTLNASQTQIIGTAIAELLSGNLSDETIMQINALKRDEIDNPLEHIVGFIQGTANPQLDRDWLISSLLGDISFLALEALDEKMKPKARTWTLTANLLLEILEGNIRETTRETIISMSNPEDTPSPCQPLVNHIRENNQATAKDLVEILITIASDQKEKMP
jgi:chorismate mutase